MTAPTEDLTTRTLVAGDAAAGFRLSAEAGWNQTADDWRCMITDGDPWGQFTPAGRLVATALIMPYGGRLAWIAMVLTTPAFRGRGLATRNLEEALRRCAVRGLIAGLDATPAGRRVYEPQGFRAVLGLHRLFARNPTPPEIEPGAPVVRRLRAAADLDAAAALDGRALGAPRRPILAYLCANQPERALVAVAGGKPAGFILARAGRRSLHLGPLVADEARTARTLVAHALVIAKGAVSIDVPDAQGEFLDFLAAAGFECQRPFTRMLRGESGVPGAPQMCFATAGPEFA